MPYDPTNHDKLSELLSAYLDGEVTADEQALVEQRMGESAEFRQLHDDLRALRGSLELLPRYKLTEDLAPIVLRRAERAMLTAPAAAQISETNGLERVSLAERVPQVGRLSRSWHIVRWSVVAVAVAVVIMVFNPGRDRNGQDVALNRDAPRDAAPEATSMPKSPLPQRGLERTEGRSLNEKLANKPDDASGISSPAAPAASSADESNAPRAPAEEPLKVDEYVEGEEVAGGKGAAEGVRDEQIKQWNKRLRDTAKPATAAVRRQPSQLLYDTAKAEDLRASANGMVVVQCEISSKILGLRAFEKLLAEQQIALVDSDTGNTPALQLGVKAAAPAGPPEAAESSVDQKFESAQGQTAGEASKSREDGGAASVDAYLVEASPAQIQATLAALGDRTEHFPSFTISEAGAQVAREGDAAAFGKEDRLSKTADEADKVEPAKPSEPVAKDSDPASGKVAEQGPDGITSEPPLDAAGGGAGGGGLGGQPERKFAFRSRGGRLEQGARAQRVLVAPSQFYADTSQDESGEKLNEESDREKSKQQDNPQIKVAAEASSSPVPTRDAPADRFSAPAAAPAPLVESAPPADSVPGSSAKELPRQDAATEPQVPSVRVLFLFRTAVPAAASER